MTYRKGIKDKRGGVVSIILIFGVICVGLGWFIGSSKGRGMLALRPRRWSVGVLGAAAALLAVCAPLAGSATGQNATARASVSATSCSQWNVAGTWRVLQRASATTPVFHITFRFAQSGKTVTGQGILTAAEARASGYSGTTGTLTGTLSGSRLNVVVTWPRLTNGTVVKGRYVGGVAANAITAGQAWPLAQPSVKVTWTASGRARCVRH